MTRRWIATIPLLPPRLLALFALFALLALAAGHGLFAYVQRQITELQWDILEAQANERLREIRTFTRERSEEAQAFLQHPMMRQALQAYLARGEARGPAWRAFEGQIEVMVGHRGYEDILLLDPEGKVRYHRGAPVTELTVKRQAAAEALRQRQVVFRDFAVPAAPGTEVRVGMALPLFDDAGRPLGALVFRIQPYLYAAPLVEEWPAFRGTAETLVFRLQEGDIVFLTRPRFRPIERVEAFPSLLAAQVALGDGRIAGLDYRGVPAIGVGRRIPDTPWYLVAKVDKSEITGILRQVAAGALLLTLVLLAGAATIAHALWRQGVTEARYRAQQEMQEGLRASEEALREAQRLAHVGSWAWRVEEDRSSWSDEMFRIAGRAPQSFAVTLASALGVVHPEDRERMRALTQRAVESGEGFVDEHRIVRPDGTERVVESRGEPVLSAKGQIVALRGTWLDVTERKRAEQALNASQQQVIQSEKLAALGTLAASVVHELNNPLMGVMGYLRAAQELTQQSQAAQYLEKASRELARMRELLKNMLGFARPIEERTTKVSVPMVLERTLALMRPEFKVNDIGVTTEIADDLPLVPTKEGNLQQVLVNLLMNARDALEGQPERQLTVRAHREADTLRIEVADSGPGIPPHRQERIFDPFFTTKPPGLGTGLGLSISRNIMADLGGTLTVRSREGEGATFTMTLPLEHEAGG